MEATFKELLDLCKEHGFDTVITALNKTLKANENMQAYLFAGDHNQQQQASKMSEQIIKQTNTIIFLEKKRDEFLINKEKYYET